MLDRLPGVRKRGCNRATSHPLKLFTGNYVNNFTTGVEFMNAGQRDGSLSLSSSRHLEKDRGVLTKPFALVLIFSAIFNWAVFRPICRDLLMIRLERG